MDLIKLNKIISGKYESEISIENTFISTKELSEKILEFKRILQFSEGFKSRFNLTESSGEFFKACPDFRKFLGADYLEDVFYATKLGYYFENVPPRLTFILQKALRRYDTPNNAICSISTNTFGRFLKAGSLPKGITIKSVIENILGIEYQEITEARPAVKFKKCYELYVPNVNRVVILPDEYGTYLNSLEDLNTVEYVKDVGVCLCGAPLRTFCGRMGITKDEFDLRQVM